MRKALLIVALLAVALAATPASAVIYDNASGLPDGQYKAKYSNYSDLYWAAGTTATQDGQGSAAGANGLPLDFQNATAPFTTAVTAYLTSGANSPGTLENRAVFNATTIQTLSSATVWNGSSQQLSGLFYNLTLAGVSIVGTNVKLDFVPSTRSTPLSGPGLATLPAHSGGVIEIYANSSLPWATAGNAPDPNNVGILTVPQTIAAVNGSAAVNNGTGPWGPSSWVAGAGPTSDSYVGATGGSLWLSGAFVPFSYVGITAADGDPNTVFEENLDLSTGFGHATGDVMVVGGSDYANIGKADLVTAGNPVDLTLGADEATPSNDFVNLGPSIGDYSGSGYWPVDSEDPVKFDVVLVPEPATLSLLAFGLVGLLARRRK